MKSLLELMRWQWRDYPRYHADRMNVVLHILTVPVFWVGSMLLVAALLRLDSLALLAGLACWAMALLAQGAGHRREAVPPAPFTGPANFAARFLIEQWVNFPRFLVQRGRRAGRRV